jgi:curved DNA-binding protein CbpA
MPNSQHVSILKEGARAWNAWRGKNPRLEPQLGHLNLPVGHRQFGAAQGGPIDLSQADLCGAALEHATLIDADLTGAYLVQANLSHARLRGANLAGANLSQARLIQADLKDACLEQATLGGANLREARNLTQAQIEQAYGDEGSLLPAGLVRPAAWPTSKKRKSTELARRLNLRSAARNLDPYTLLGVSRRASLQEIRAAYLKLVKELHPDGRELDPIASEQLKTINKAYQDLKVGERRAAARQAERKWFARPGVLFVTAFLGSSLTLLAILGGLYWAGSFPGDDQRQSLAAASPNAAESAGDVGTRSAPASATSEREPADTAALAGARAAADDAAWIEAEREATSASLHRYLGRYSNGRHARTAAAELPTVVNTEIALSKTFDARNGPAMDAARLLLRHYLDVYPGGRLAPEVERKLNAIAAAEAEHLADNDAWAEAQRAHSSDALRRYLANHPSGENAANARTALATIEASEARERADHTAWGDAIGDGSKAALHRYLAAYPDGANAAQARVALAAIEASEERRKADRVAWAKANRDGSKAALARYLAAFPEGNHADHARASIAVIEASEEHAKADRAAWDRAEEAGTKAAFSGYLVAFPDGEYASLARKMLTAIETSEASRQGDRTALAEPPQTADSEARRGEGGLNRDRDIPATGKNAPLLETAPQSMEQAPLREYADWLRAQRRRTKASYAAYLLTHPNGRHAKQARANIAELQNPAAKTKPAQASKVVKQVTQASRAYPSETPASQKWQSADEPFIGADGRIRQR